MFYKTFIKLQFSADSIKNKKHFDKQRCKSYTKNKTQYEVINEYCKVQKFGAKITTK